MEELVRVRVRTKEQEQDDGRGRGTAEGGVLEEWAQLVLPWLDPAELTAISSTCKTLNRISKCVTARRASDASRGFESLPIPFFNPLHDHRRQQQPYAYFIYTPTQLQLQGSPSSLAPLLRQPWGESRPLPLPLPLPLPYSVSPSPSGCDCESERCDDGDSAAACPCYNLQNSSLLVLECGPSCRCALRPRHHCGNRLTQGGISLRLKIVKDARKGWGLHAGEFIGRDQFVCEYAGELLTTKEARERQQRYDQLSSGGRFCSALLVVREHLPSGKACMRMNIDATVIGNVARFINHSCDGGNLSTVLVRSSGALLPRLCFFASRDIQEGEELTFSYGENRVRSKGLQCFCGSSSCSGILPSEVT
ncbi:histone-lysine N-methyltransferase SUVR3 [Diospyros lotus]|uniref:histone-lysine N-methyltransferase SUVR3 n=1 Tax=Diospyros lotus TaxID=55363 RepID=UPI002254C393|nr:histone-lysine N-methyltransferase SUVR3 [Diospyros lotus]